MVKSIFKSQVFKNFRIFLWQYLCSNELRSTFTIKIYLFREDIAIITEVVVPSNQLPKKIRKYSIFLRMPSSFAHAFYLAYLWHFVSYIHK